MTVTLKDFQAFAQQRLVEGITIPGQFPAKLKEVFDFATANESEMDAEANAYFDTLLDATAAMIENGLTQMADGPGKRKLLRMVAFTRSKHHRAENFLKGLGRPLPKPFPVAEAGKVIFVDAVQSILDLLFDATRDKQRGVGQFASISLLYWTVDELNVAFYLSERKYTTQAYSHLRTVHDLLDKAELFFEQPQWADLWGGPDTKKILDELKPSKVRKKLGRPGFDPVYGFFTERGVHGTFGAVKKRTMQRGKVQGIPQVAMWLGGVAWDEEVDIAVASCIFTAVLTLSTIAKVYADRLDPSEVRGIFQSRSTITLEFLRRHLIKPLQDEGEDVSALILVLDRFERLAA